ncbi:hypothetical protein MXB_4022, partial [Myxobolus squamalis]
MNERIKTLEGNYAEKIRNIENDYQQRVGIMSSSNSPCNGHARKVMDDKSQLESVIDKINEIENQNEEFKQKIQSYKFLIVEKDRYIDSMMDENRMLADRLNSINDIEKNNNELISLQNIDSSNTLTWHERLGVHEIIQSSIDLNEKVGKALQSFFVDKNSLNPHSLIQSIEKNIKKIGSKFASFNESSLAHEVVHQGLLLSQSKMNTSTKVINEQTLLIGNLINEIKRIKTSYKNSISILKNEIFKEKELRLIDAASRE